MGKSLINAYQSDRNVITHIYTENGKVYTDKVNFKPFAGYHANPTEKTKWHDIYGKPVVVKVFDNIDAFNYWKKQNRDVFQILGDISPVNQFIASQYMNDIVLDKTGMSIANLDIEVYVKGGGFCFPDKAAYPINAITINEMITNTYFTFGIKDYIVQNTNETYIKCKDESDLIVKFLAFWNEMNPQIITGWNIDTFDIPYLVNRITKVMGASFTKQLSIDRNITKHTSTNKLGQENVTYKLQGHIIWDYMDLYIKYAKENLEAYTLDHVCFIELNKKKIEYEKEYGSLVGLYEQNPQKFIEYNIKDTALIYELDDKLDFINVALSLMQKAKCQPEDIYGTVKPWDSIIYNDLLHRKILCPPIIHHTKVDFIGGYVGEPIKGFYKSLLVNDIVSSYPNQDISANMSPETIVNDIDLTPELLRIRTEYGSIKKCIDIDNLAEIAPILRKYNYSFTSNGQFFRRDKKGIIPELFSKFFAERQEYKILAKQYKKEGKTREYKIADSYQYTLKILLNSGYGFLSNIYSRYFDIRIAEAITSNGQVSVRGATKATIDAYPIIKNVYNDTDSCFLSCEEVIKKRFGDIEPTEKVKLDFILSFYDKCLDPVIAEFFKKMGSYMNFRENTINMELECVADLSIFVAKKKYIMNKIWDEGTYMLDNPKRKIRGVEIVRSSTPQIVRNKLKEAVEIIFTTASNEELIKLVNTFKKEFFNSPIEIVAFPRSVTIGTYTLNSPKLPIGARAALTYNSIIKKENLEDKLQLIADGDKIKFCYIKEPNIMHSHVIGFVTKFPEELQTKFEIDYETQFEKTFLDPLNNILECINWQTEVKETLEDFFL